MASSNVHRIDRQLVAVLKKHLASYNYIFGKAPDTMHRELARAYGRARYDEHLHIADAMLAGFAPARRLYERPRTLSEAGILISFQADLALATNAAMLEVAAPWLATARRVCELGCWTGGVTTFIGKSHPTASVVGIEALPSLVRIAQEATKAENVEFRLWDYSAVVPANLPPAELLLTALGIDFEMRVPELVGDTREDLQVEKGYRARVAEAATYWSRWKDAATADATAVTVLRIATPRHLLAFAEGASQHGWRLDVGASRFVIVKPERFPVLVWHRQTGRELTVADLASFWNHGPVTAV